MSILLLTLLVLQDKPRLVEYSSDGKEKVAESATAESLKKLEAATIELASETTVTFKNDNYEIVVTDSSITISAAETKIAMTSDKLAADVDGKMSLELDSSSVFVGNPDAYVHVEKDGTWAVGTTSLKFL